MGAAAHHGHVLALREFPYRMKDLCEATGLPRQAIHFYIQQGLLPPGQKTGRNMAFYGEEHLERLRLIKQLQHERFLPLKAIKSLLDGRDEDFSPEQRTFLVEVKQRLGTTIAPPARRSTTVNAAELAARTDLLLSELERAIEIGLVGGYRDPSGALFLAEDDVWMIELFSQMRAVGFSRELGFSVDDMTVYEEAMTKLFRQETKLLSSRLSHLPPDRVAPMIEKILPLIHQFLTRYHASRVRDFFATM